MMLDPAERSARGAAIGAQATGAALPPPGTPLAESRRDFVYAEVWSRPGLDLRARFLVGLAASAIAGGGAELDALALGALTSGALSLGELREAALHLAVYAGWGRGEAIDAAATRAAESVGLPPAPRPPIRAAPWDPAVRSEEGAAEFAAVMTFPGAPPASPFLEAIRNFVFGEMWCRTDGLDQRARRWLTLVGVCASMADVPMRSHVHAAMASGNCTPAEMQEFVLQYGVHCGWPRASQVQSIVFEMIRKVEAGLAYDG